jgi:hypothetical protein
MGILSDIFNFFVTQAQQQADNRMQMEEKAIYEYENFISHKSREEQLKIVERIKNSNSRTYKDAYLAKLIKENL